MRRDTPRSASFPDLARAAKRPRRADRQDLGQVLVIFTLSIVVFVGMCAVVVDVAWYWANNLRMQRAADAAALAGVVWLPAEPVRAESVARAEAAKNGYRSGTDGYTVTPLQDPTDPRRMMVNIRGPVRTFFANLFGLTALQASRDAKAEYVLPVPMGSPANYYGVGYFEKRDPGSAAQSGPNQPHGAATSGIDSGFTDRTNAFAFDGAVATGVVGQGTTGRSQSYGAFGVSIASGSVIDGIEVRVAARSSDPGGCRLGVELSWNGGSSWTTTGGVIDLTGSAPSSIADAPTVGGPTARWDRRWAPSDLVTGSLLVRVRALDPDPGSDPTGGDPSTCDAGAIVAIDALDLIVYSRAAGSVGAHLLDDPRGTSISRPNDFWGAIFTAAGNRRNGDYFAPAFVDGAPSPSHTAGGYDYTVDLTSSSDGEVWIFDPVFCATGTNGHGGWFGAGDHWTEFRSAGGGIVARPVAITFRLFDTHASPHDTSDDTLVETLAYDPAGRTLGDFSGEFGTPQNNAATDRQDCSEHPAHNTWVQLAGGLPGGMYRVNVETSSQAVNHDVGAENLFSLWVTASGGGRARVYGGGRMAGYTNIDTGGQRFYLAQIERVHAGKTMVIELFDPGDVDGNARLHILSPNGGVYSDVTFSYAADSRCRAGVSDACSGSGRTTIQTAAAGRGSSFDGSVVTITIPLPADYGADGLTPPGETEEGWWKIQYDVADANDTTTWQVSIRGNPVHLVIP